MKKILLSSALIFISIITFGQSYNGPESIEYDYAGDRYFVANSNSGEIIARANDGTLSVFASGLTTGPYGMEIVGNVIYACDGGAIKGFDLSNGSVVANVNLGATFLNGITHVGTDLFITDFSAKKIYRFNTLTNAYNVYVTGLSKSPNGIIYDQDDNRLVFVNWGSSAPVMAVNLADSSVTTLTTTTLGNCDGIAMNCSGQFYVASWSPTRISRFENDFINSPVDMGVTGLSSPADIFYNTAEDTLAIPNSGNNTVKFVQYSDCLSMSVAEVTEPEFEIFPNPASNSFTLKLKNVIAAQISDASGRVVSNITDPSFVNQVDISGLTDGIYFVTIDGETEKLIIQR